MAGVQPGSRSGSVAWATAVQNTGPRPATAYGPLVPAQRSSRADRGSPPPQQVVEPVPDEPHPACERPGVQRGIDDGLVEGHEPVAEGGLIGSVEEVGVQPVGSGPLNGQRAGGRRTGGGAEDADERSQREHQRRHVEPGRGRPGRFYRIAAGRSSAADPSRARHTTRLAAIAARREGPMRTFVRTVGTASEVRHIDLAGTRVTVHVRPARRPRRHPHRGLPGRRPGPGRPTTTGSPSGCGPGSSRRPPRPAPPGPGGGPGREPGRPGRPRRLRRPPDRGGRPAGRVRRGATRPRGRVAAAATSAARLRDRERQLLDRHAPRLAGGRRPVPGRQLERGRTSRFTSVRPRLAGRRPRPPVPGRPIPRPRAGPRRCACCAPSKSSTTCATTRSSSTSSWPGRMPHPERGEFERHVRGGRHPAAAGRVAVPDQPAGHCAWASATPGIGSGTPRWSARSTPPPPNRWSIYSPGARGWRSCT